MFLLFLFLNISFINVEDTMLEIDFQDFFQNDEVSLRINDCDIFDKLKLTSDKVLGLTNVSVIMVKINSKKSLIKYKGHHLYCDLRKEVVIKIQIILNDRKSVFIINLSKGKYIGFDKCNKNKLYINQSKYPFEYE